MSTTDTRAAFEKRFGQNDSFAWRDENDNYKVASLQSAWEVWQAATEAAKAEQSQDKPVMYCVPDKNGKPLFGKGWMFSPIPQLAATMPLYTRPAAKATGTAGELPPLPEGKAWASPLRYGSKIGFPKPVKPANWDDDDGVDWFCDPYFTVAQMREYGQACAEAARHDADAAKRLRLICKLVGIESHVPADDETLWGAAFAVLGKVRAALEAARQPAPVMLSDEDILMMASQHGVESREFSDECVISLVRAALAATNRSQP